MTVRMIEGPTDVKLGEVTRLRVAIVGGDVSVVGGDGPASLEVAAVEGEALRVEQAGGVVTIGYEQAPLLRRWFGGVHGPDRRRVSLSVAVPEGCRVQVDSVTAALTVVGLAAGARVRTVSGALVLDGLGGPVKAQTVSGPVEGRRLAGPLTLETVSGDLVVAGAGGAVSVKTVSGEVVMDLADAVADAGSPDPGLEHLGGGSQAGEVSVVTVSGDVTLRLGRRAGARVELTSTSGRVETTFDGLVRDSAPGRRRVDGVIGDGSARVKGTSVSGDVALLARR